MILVLGALAIPFLKGSVKQAWMLLLPVWVFVSLLFLPLGTHWTTDFLGYELIFGRVDKLSYIFALVFTIMAFMGVLFALRVEDDLQHVSALVYAGATLGVVLAGDWLSLYLFWEIMAVSSTFLVMAARTKASREAGFRYLLVHIVGGLFLLAGIVFYIH
ncbi:MAG: Na(+)/H(+) antiporter subunit D, partial [Desulfobacterales bacterium]|nr:Na(+)/H(+) antiporter subunit D [Desulfobacterales bacterium]